jgi:alcohol dehydrogenase (cytochrome c)
VAAGLVAAAGAADWPQPNGAPSGTRSTDDTTISSSTVGRLRVRWRFPLPPGSAFGSFASTPIAVGRTVYAQTLSSSVFALDARTGAVRWRTLFKAPNDGPNGLAATRTRVFGTTDAAVFALDRRTGRRVWAHQLVGRYEQFMSIAPLASRGLVFVSTIGVSPGGRGALYALDQRTGKIRWRFDTIRDPWPHPTAAGGGAWYTPSLGPDGTLYVGVANPVPWGGTKARPNGAVFAGPALYTDSLLALRAATGKLLWFDQVTRHDVRDYDFQTSPIVVGNRVFGAGKAGRVVAWNRTSHRRVWAQSVGTHLHDLGPLPASSTRVCPGLWGGVLTPMSYAHGRLFAPVVEQCMRESAIRVAEPASAYAADGVVTAIAGRTGRKLWVRRLGAAPMGCTTVARDVVFAPTLDGRVLGLSTATGRVLWQRRERAGINGCPLVTSDLLVVGVGAPRARHDVRELVAYEVAA